VTAATTDRPPTIASSHRRAPHRENPASSPRGQPLDTRTLLAARNHQHRALFRLVPRRWLHLCAILGLAGGGFTHQASGQAATPPASLTRIREAVHALATAPGVVSGTVGFYLARLESPDRPIIQRHSSQSFIPASTMKVVTTGAALDLLGPEFVFETRVSWHPATGDLVIHGAGDPTLGRGGWEETFDEWLAGLRTHGIREVRGRVIADESAWTPEDVPGGWTWLDLGNYYAPSLTPLAFHDNEFRLWFRLRGRPGDPARWFDAEPWPDGLRLTDAVTIGEDGTGDEAYAFAAPRSPHITVRGTLARDAGKEFIRLALPDPALFGAQQFTAFLNTRSVPVHGAPTTSRRINEEGGKPVDRGPAVTVAVHRSAPLRDLLIPINYRSLNLDCECLLRTLGDGEAEAGAEAIRAHMAERKLPLVGFHQADGSGLARTNMLTPALLARFIASVLTGPNGQDFVASLPVLGSPHSTLRRLRPSSAGATIHAKSGTIERVKAYAGVVESASGRRAVFAIMVNNYDGPYGPQVGPGLARLFEALESW